MKWAFRRKIVYGSIFLVIVLGIAFLFLYPLINKTPTCTDGRKNGDEVGVDCGGSCIKYCVDQLTDPVVVWSRSFLAAPGIYNSVAYIENRNNNAYAPLVLYRFRLYDDSGVLIGERTGTSYIGLKGRSVVFESGIVTGTRIPARTVFEFTSNTEWEVVSAESSAITLLSGNTQFTRTTGNPRVSADIKNNSLFTLPDIGAAVLLYGDDGNVFAVSKTVIDKLVPGEQKTIYFSWPQGLESDPNRIEILTVFDPTSIRRK